MEEQKTYKCPGCPCFFFTPEDLERHKHAEPFQRSPKDHNDTFKRLHEKLESFSEDPEGEVKKEGEWQPSNRGDGYFCLAERQQFIVKLILQKGDGTRWTRLEHDPLNEYRLSYRDRRPFWVSKRPIKPK